MPSSGILLPYQPKSETEISSYSETKRMEKFDSPVFPIVQVYMPFSEITRSITKNTQICAFYNEQKYEGTIEDMADLLRVKGLSIENIKRSIPEHESYAECKDIGSKELLSLEGLLKDYPSSGRLKALEED